MSDAWGRKRTVLWVIHSLFCIAILVFPLLIMLRYGMEVSPYYTGYVIRTGILMGLFYLNYLFLIDKFLFRKQFVVYIAINLLLLAGIIFLQNLVFHLLIGPPPPLEGVENRPPFPVELRILGDYILIVFVIGMGVALKMTQKWYKDSVNLETIKASQLEADLKHLRSQLNPHFLFNTLNNIYSLIAIDAAKAQESVYRLSNLLRYILYENESKFVPVEKELQFTQHYIDLMRLRLRNEVALRVAIQPGKCDREIASLLFITLIENAFKHGIQNGPDSFIDIRIYADNEKGVRCTVENSLAETGEGIESKNGGIGLSNLQKRLQLLYPDRHELRIEKQADRFCVHLAVYFDKTGGTKQKYNA